MVRDVETGWLGTRKLFFNKTAFKVFVPCGGEGTRRANSTIDYEAYIAPGPTIAATAATTTTTTTTARV